MSREVTITCDACKEETPGWGVRTAHVVIKSPGSVQGDWSLDLCRNCAPASYQDLTTRLHRTASETPND
jgi:hypothetical protein